VPDFDALLLVLAVLALTAAALAAGGVLTVTLKRPRRTP
jgi:hypothetical protein